MAVEQSHNLLGKNLDAGESEQTESGRSHYGQSDDLDHPAEVTCAEIIADDRLRSLADAHHRHQDQHQHPVDDAERCHRESPAVSQQVEVEHHHHQPCADLQ